MLRPNKELCKCGKQKSQVAKTCWECRKNRLTGKCKICGTEYRYKASTSKQTCSSRCAYKLHGERSRNTQSRKITLICEYCDKPKIVSPTYKDRRFCSPDCWAKSNSGANNPRWQGGITSERAKADSSSRWRQLCKTIWTRDNAICQRCKIRFNHTQRTYEVHHVVPFRVESLRHEPTNLVLLCDPCHIWVHSRANTSKIFISLPA
ncbi:MAG: HNH endonuclease [Nitrosotalea sp.]